MSEIKDFLIRAKTSVDRGKPSIQNEGVLYNEFEINMAPATPTLAPIESLSTITINQDFNPWEAND